MRRQPFNCDEWRSAARARLPRLAFDFIDGGADDEVTLCRNREAFDEVELLPRVLQAAAQVDLACTLFGETLTMPLLLAPTGASTIAGRDGELAAARGSWKAGTLSVLSGYSGISPERVAASTPRAQWFQLYMHADRQSTRRIVDQARALGYSALVVTVDTPVVGNRERDLRNGFSIPVRIRPRHVWQGLLRPRWSWHYLSAGPIGPAQSKRQPGERPTELLALAEYVSASTNAAQSWDDLAWVRDIWEGPLLVKGVLRADDARMARSIGCDGIVVSNHGGRQLDGVPGTLDVLPEVASAVGDGMTVLLDGGVRRGSDVLKALSLGADACLVGRPWLYALAAGGEAGVTAMLEQLRAEMMRAMQLMGVAKLAELGPGCVLRR